ncbi:MAG: NAD-dependent succinate-semialdehyde dehydrogenase [Chthoniobacteraceae bacterium]
MDIPTPLQLETFSEKQIGDALEAATAAFAKWRATSFGERTALMERAADLLEDRAEELARMITTEMGKPLGAAVEEIRKCARCCIYYAEHAVEFLAEENVEGPALRNLVRYEPIGPVLAVMPWNFPFWQVFRFAAPALMAGNVALLKHASNVPGCAMAIEQVFADAGFPNAVFQSLLIPSERVKAIIHDPRVRAVTLTGSVTAGRQVAAEAGAALKKTVMELGGSDPFLITPSADLDRAVAAAVKARTVNTGQSCVAAKRFIIDQSIYDQVERRMVEAMRGLIIGDPLDSATQIGPLATVAIADELDRQVQDAIKAGARLLTGGRRLQGSYYEPTVLADIPSTSRVYREEVFGPVALLFRARDLHHTIELANNTEFGLGAAAWTTDTGEQQQLIAELNAGVVFINGIVASDPRLPFGGIKNSGYGRELGAFGIKEFVNVKAVCAEPR